MPEQTESRFCSLKYLQQLAKLYRNNPAGQACRWAANEIERLQGIAWKCWRRDTMTKAEAEQLIGRPSIVWPETEAAEGEEGSNEH